MALIDPQWCRAENPTQYVPKVLIEDLSPFLMEKSSKILAETYSVYFIPSSGANKYLTFQTNKYLTFFEVWNPSTLVTQGFMQSFGTMRQLLKNPPPL